MNYESLHDDLINHRVDVDSLNEYTKEMFDYAHSVSIGKKVSEMELYSFLMLCLDYYVFSRDGKTLIPDYLYDKCMHIYTEDMSNDLVIFPDNIMNTSRWDFVEHDVPGLVGSLNKIYTYEELKSYMERFGNIHKFIIAPKYDGVSVSIRFKNGKIVKALTRYDGVVGQDITELIKRADLSIVNKYPSCKKGDYTGYLKCEIVLSNDMYNELIKYKHYSNRRSAVSGIVNTPKNIPYGKYLTILPLLSYDNGRVIYNPPLFMTSDYYHTRDMMDDIENMIEKVKNSDFPYRVDGAVIYPVSNESLEVNPYDLLENAIAFKINTSEGVTTLEDVYFSIGRMGNAIPMAKVKPVEVNETIVTEVSLGSYEKFKKLQLIPNEIVIIYSAGDVIPQLRLPNIRQNHELLDPIVLDKHCPYCGKKLKKFGKEFKCVNQECPRVATGRIANFCEKLGFEDFSDSSISALYKADILNSIEDLFSLSVTDIKEIEGFNTKSANNIVDQVKKLIDTPIEVSKLFGALGIEDISMKKCRKIFEGISLKDLSKKHRFDLHTELITIDGIGDNTASTFLDFVDNNRKLIKFLISTLNVIPDKKFIGNVVFTGWRPDDSIHNKLASYGIDVADGVTSRTIAVVSGSFNHTSGKCKEAKRRDIPIYDRVDIDKLFKDIKKEL